MNRSLLFATLLSAALAPALAVASEITLVEPYARAASPAAKSGAAFMEIVNTSGADDRLIAVEADVAKRIELHTHKMDGDVMKMVEVEGGILIPAGSSAILKRGGDHVMLMGLTEPLADGDMLEMTFIFENAGAVAFEIPVDLQR